LNAESVADNHSNFDEISNQNESNDLLIKSSINNNNANFKKFYNPADKVSQENNNNIENTNYSSNNSYNNYYNKHL
jgi:hypothetical protein